jgi:hypothetical protein
MNAEITPIVEELMSVVAEEAIALAAKEFESIDANTKDGYQQNTKAIAWCRKKRNEVDKKKDELNKEALAHQRRVNAYAKKLVGLIEDIEEPLKAKKLAVDEETERQRKELAEKHAKWINARIAKSVEVTGKAITTVQAESWSDEQFEEHLETGRKAKEEADAKAKAEAARLAQEDADRKAKIKAEQDQLAADKAELARQKAEQEAEAKRIKDQQDEVDRQRREIEQQLEAGRKAQEEIDKRNKLEAQKQEALNAYPGPRDHGKRLAQLPSNFHPEPDRGCSQEQFNANIAGLIAQSEADLSGESIDVIRNTTSIPTQSDRYAAIKANEFGVLNSMASLTLHSKFMVEHLRDPAVADLQSRATEIQLLLLELDAEIKAICGDDNAPF